MMSWLAILVVSIGVGTVLGYLAAKLAVKPRRPPNQEPYQPPGVFIREEGTNRIEVWNLEGVDWYTAPIPPREHLCWTQTMGTLLDGTFIRRCACGAISMNDVDDQDIYWSDRNNRKVTSIDG